jgi:hypothetical protein
MRLHFVKIDPSGKTYSDIIAKVTDSNLGFVFKHDDSTTENGIVYVLPNGVAEIIHTSGGLTFITIYARASDMMMIIQMLKDSGVDLREFQVEVMK